jgi:hypothetical protein
MNRGNDLVCRRRVRSRRTGEAHRVGGSQLEGGDSNLLEQQGRIRRCIAERRRIAAGSPRHSGVVRQRRAFPGILAGKVKIPNEQARGFVNAVQNAKESAQARRIPLSRSLSGFYVTRLSFFFRKDYGCRCSCNDELTTQSYTLANARRETH